MSEQKLAREPLKATGNILSSQAQQVRAKMDSKPSEAMTKVKLLIYEKFEFDMIFKETKLSCIHFLLNFRKTPFIQNYQKGSQQTDGNYPILKLVDPLERVNLAMSIWLEKKGPNS